jgi:hypothetical protein
MHISIIDIIRFTKDSEMDLSSHKVRHSKEMRYNCNFINYYFFPMGRTEINLFYISQS